MQRNHALVNGVRLLQCVLGLVVAHGVLLATVSSAQGQTVRGQVVDSLTGVPLGGATVEALSAVGDRVARTRADGEGLFLLRLPSEGRYRLRVEHAQAAPATFPEFVIGAEQIQSYQLLVSTTGELRGQALEAIVARVCPDEGVRGVVIAGWVRHASTGTVADSAAVVVSWSTIPAVLDADATFSEFSGAAVPDSSGFYAICGVPLNTRIWMHAMNPDGLSSFWALTFGPREVTVGTSALPLNGRIWVQDLTILDDVERSSRLAGTVTAAADGSPVRGVEVELLGTPFATETDLDGGFSFEGLPPGRPRLIIKGVGWEPLRREISLPDGGVLELPGPALALNRPATELAPITVEATASLSPLAEFNDRRSKGTGSFITREEFEKQGNPLEATDVLRRMQGIRIEPSRDPEQKWIISMRRGGPRGFGFAAGGDGSLDGSSCPPLFFLDRQFIGNAKTINVDNVIALTEVAAVEAHSSVASLPMEFNRRGSQCGVIAFWTRKAQPRTIPAEKGSSSILSKTGFHLLVAVGAVVLLFVTLGQKIYF